ncbi:NAD-dependent epimerase/dehydratase family protein [Microlunatus elymi]|uniref:NAD-dependent epimerase/dehydratase family protein n=1 Tax=Microlunatus elymi TaxID=2596828 RepID=A0A516Q1K6_9ACTN|nr:NAD(P)H-binding protein [Microlunatus elymi]QDP97317.1 NAD-dependent epimerase/dehydratase family protein [Microlunatus elymi]
MIVITAPTGQIGSQLINNLLDSDEELRLIARDPAKLPESVRRRTEIIEGSHGDPTVVDKAFSGADAVFWLYPADPYALDVRAETLAFTRPAAEAIAAHGISRMVVVSAAGRGFTERAGLLSNAWEMTDLLASSGAHLRELALPTFMDNLLRQIDPIVHHGFFFDPSTGSDRRPMVATRDIAAVAAELLLDRGWTGRAARPVYGPQDLTLDEMAVIMSEELDRPVRYQQVPITAYRGQFLELGFSASMADAMAEMAIAKNDGVDSYRPRTPESTTPTSFRTWCTEVLKPSCR